MIDWLLKLKANTLVYLFYSPWILLFSIPLTPFYGNTSMIILPVLLILWIQMMLYYSFTIMISKRLILLDKKRFTSITLSGFFAHSLINLMIFNLAFFLIIMGDYLDINTGLSVPLLFMFTISEIFRAKSISNLIVGLELKRKVKLTNYLLTFFLIINPLIGLWNIHSRIKILILKDQSETNNI